MVSRLITRLTRVFTLAAHADWCNAAIIIARSCRFERMSPYTAVLRQMLEQRLSTAVSIHFPSSRSLGDLAVVADIAPDYDGAAEAVGLMTPEGCCLHRQLSVCLRSETFVRLAQCFSFTIRFQRVGSII